MQCIKPRGHIKVFYFLGVVAKQRHLTSQTLAMDEWFDELLQHTSGKRASCFLEPTGPCLKTPKCLISCFILGLI